MSDQIQRSQLQRLSLPDFAGGINSANPQTDIADNEVVDALNFEYDDSNNLVTRNGGQRRPANGPFAIWDVSLWDSTTDFWGVTTDYTTRITSMHLFQDNSGNEYILFTQSNKLYSMTKNGLTITDITGSLTLPVDTFWQWVNFNGVAIGVNKATSGDNPVKVTGAYPGTAAALGGSPPKAKYIEVWNNRVWITRADTPNTHVIRASKLGDHETWSTTGGTTANEGFEIALDNFTRKITGIKAFKEKMVVFFEKSIYLISPIDAANVSSGSLIFNPDPKNLRVDLFTQNIGCISPYSIQTVLDDIVFLSEGGIASLQAALITGDFRSSLVSRKIKELSSIQRVTEEIPSLVVEDMSQYWISIPAVAHTTGVGSVFVMDYRRISEGIIRWTRFEGLPAGTAFTSWVEDKRVYGIGATSGANKFFPVFYSPKANSKTFIDYQSAYAKNIRTKAYGFGTNLLRKLFKYWKLALELLTNNVQISINYFFNTRTNVAGTYGFNLVASTSGSQYDVSVYDSATYDASTQAEEVIRREIKLNSAGRKGRNIQFLISNNQSNQGFIIKQFDIGYFIEHEQESEDIN